MLPSAITLSTRYFVEAGSTSPLNRFIRIRTNPKKISFRRGQMISANACFRLAPEIFVLGLDIPGRFGVAGDRREENYRRKGARVLGVPARGAAIDAAGLQENVRPSGESPTADRAPRQWPAPPRTPET